MANMKITSMVAEQYRKIHPGYNWENPPGGGGPKLENPIQTPIDQLKSEIEQLRNEMEELKMTKATEIPRIMAGVAQLRGDFDAAVGRFEKAIADLRAEFNEAQHSYDAEIAVLHEDLAALRERLTMVAGAGNNI